MDEVEDMAEEKVSDNVEEFGSLESKKRHLHLQDNGASETHVEQLSTWRYSCVVSDRDPNVCLVVLYVFVVESDSHFFALVHLC